MMCDAIFYVSASIPSHSLIISIDLARTFHIDAEHLRLSSIHNELYLGRAADLTYAIRSNYLTSLR